MKLLFVLLVTAFLFTNSLLAQSIIKDINSDTANAFEQGTNPEFVFWNSTLYFAADNGTHGNELWKSNGTSAGTLMVKDIRKGIRSSSPYNLTVLGSALLFIADDGTGEALWKTTGTDSGTTKIKAFKGPSRRRNCRTSDKSTAVIGTTMYFAAEDETNGVELWKTDGTTKGTVMVKNIHETGDSNPAKMTVMNNVLYFSADDGENGYELWKSDGTATGTVVVKNINVQDNGSGGTFGSDPSELTVMNSCLYFAADDGINGIELWKSLGTEGTTSMVYDLNVGSEDSSPSSLVVMDGYLYFAATNSNLSGKNGRELWRCDGTDIALVKDITGDTNDSNPELLTVVGKTLFFRADIGTGTGVELWRSNGTSDTTAMVADLNDVEGSTPDYLTAVNGTLFFTAKDTENGRELWKSDGTAEGTSHLKDINDGLSDSIPEFLINCNGVLYFTAFDGSSYSRYNLTGRELWKSQGTEATTVNVANINKNSKHTFSSSTSDLDNLITSIGKTMYFLVDQGDKICMWKSDGTNAGTIQTTPTNITAMNKLQGTSTTLFWTRNTSRANDELYKDNSTGTGILVKDQSDQTITATNLYAAGAYLYMQRINDSNKTWVTDGTSANTYVVTDGTNNLSQFNGNPGKCVVFSNVLYFTSQNGDSKNKLFKITTNFHTASVIKKTDASGAEITDPSNLTVFGTSLYFIAPHPTSGTSKLWKINANGFGDMMLPDNDDFDPDKIIGFAGTWLYCRAPESGGYYLWRSNGTDVGTGVLPSLIADVVNPGIGAGSLLYYQCPTVDGNYTLYQTDGTNNGTKAVKDSNGRLFSGTSLHASSGSNVYFSYNDGLYGKELWTTTGTSSATKMVMELNPTGSTEIYKAFTVNNVLYFILDNGSYGRELWKK